MKTYRVYAYEISYKDIEAESLEDAQDMVSCEAVNDENGWVWLTTEFSDKREDLHWDE